MLYVAVSEQLQDLQDVTTVKFAMKQFY